METRFIHFEFCKLRTSSNTSKQVCLAAHLLFAGELKSLMDEGTKHLLDLSVHRCHQDVQIKQMIPEWPQPS